MVCSWVRRPATDISLPPSARIVLRARSCAEGRVGVLIVAGGVTSVELVVCTARRDVSLRWMRRAPRPFCLTDQGGVTLAPAIPAGRWRSAHSALQWRSEPLSSIRSKRPRSHWMLFGRASTSHREHCRRGEMIPTICELKLRQLEPPKIPMRPGYGARQATVLF